VGEASLSEWISVKAAAEYTGYTASHVRYLLRNGLVKGQRFGRDWFTTKKALDEYLATNPRPGPEPKKRI
jgi:excisionase family DNA binding protein